MNTLLLLIELFLTMHALLFISAWLIPNRGFSSTPSFKLKVARLLLFCCVTSPLAVHCLTPTEKPLILQYISLDAMQNYASRPILHEQPLAQANESTALSPLVAINYWELLGLFFCLVAIGRSFRLFADLNKLKSIIQTAIPYRSCGKLAIKVSADCHIPFSVRSLRRAYIILPVSLLTSTQDVKIAIAHEGQHHRNGDCVWAYFIESVRVVFIGNPGVTRWHRVLTELQELSCDEALVGHQKISAHDYGRCLFHVVQAVSNYPKSSHREIACTVGMAMGTDQQESEFIIRRITMLTSYQGNPTQRMLLGITLAGVVVVAPICTAYAAMGTLSGSKARTLDTSAIDPSLQHLATNEIAAAVKRYHANSGAIAIVEPSTGKIIAFAEAGKVSGSQSWKSRIFTPASTIKPFIAAAAIDAGVATESTTYDCQSPYSVGGVTFTNHSPAANSRTLADAMAQSDNVCLIKVGQAMKPKALRDKLTGFGFDMDSWWRKDQSSELQLAQASIGVNVPVTLQALTKSYGMLANQGNLSKNAIIAKPTAHSVTHMLEGVVQYGTGKPAAIKGVAVAGKSGTLEDSEGGTHLALFAGYVPADAPRYAMVVVIDGGYNMVKGEKTTAGGALAAPVFRKVVVQSLKTT